MFLKFLYIPLQETIDMAINLIFNDNPNLNITKEELKKLFLFVTSQTHFIFNSKIFNCGCIFSTVCTENIKSVFEVKRIPQSYILI